MKKILVYIFCFTLLISLCYAESIWDDKQAGLYSRNVSLNVGDSVRILITENSKINYKSSSKSNKTGSVSIDGGQYSAIFGFLPTGNGIETSDTDNKDESEISGSLVANVSAVSNNTVTLQGRKSVTLNNKTSIVEISGIADTKFIKNGSLYSSDIQNLTVKVTTLLANDKAILQDSDIITRLKNPDNSDDLSTETVISEEKQKELYLKYVNQILGTIY